jgi:hypothetical protein
MELEAVRIGPGEYFVRDAETGEHLTFILEERQARILAEAERAVMVCRDLAALIPSPAPHTLASQAQVIAEAAGMRRKRVFVFTTNDGVTILGGDLGGDDEADSG